MSTIDVVTLKNRIFHSKCQLEMDQPSDSHRPQNYKNWEESRLYKAFLAIKEDGFSIRRAAETYNVPKSTLQDRVTGRVEFGCKSGPETYLSDKEENELIDFLEGCTDIGYSRSKKQVIEMVQLVLYEKGKNVTISEGWWYSFKRRHPQLTLRTAEPVSYARLLGTRREILERYFDLLELTFNEYDFHNNPCSIFNMDETGMPLNPIAPKVVVPKGTKNPMAATTGDKSQITVVSSVL
jgi:hypothetical protein